MSLDAIAQDMEGVDSGWQAQLDLEFSRYADSRTILSHRRQFGPLTVQRAFYPEGDVCHLYILHPPGGIVGGDILQLNAVVKERASCLLTAPGATKFYRSQGYQAHQMQGLTVSDQGTLEWLPQENIYFPGAKVTLDTVIKLARQARFIGWDIHCLGLPSNNEKFLDGQLDLKMTISRAGKPVIVERLFVNADRIENPTGLRGCSVMGMLVAVPADEKILDKVRVFLDDKHEILIAATLVEECLIVRYIGNSTAQVKTLFTHIWMVLRPSLLNREACPPRIWAT